MIVNISANDEERIARTNGVLTSFQVSLIFEDFKIDKNEKNIEKAVRRPER